MDAGAYSHLPRPISRKAQCSSAVDIGNTTIQLGLWHGDSWRNIWRARTDAAKLPDEYAALFRQFFQSADLPITTVNDVVMSSVVPALTDTFRHVFAQLFGLEALVIRHDLPGVRVDIEHPEQAGADRLVNAAAVHALYGGPAIVIDFGTATNFDVVSAQGEYIGGAIAPGMQVAHERAGAHGRSPAQGRNRAAAARHRPPTPFTPCNRASSGVMPASSRA